MKALVKAKGFAVTAVDVNPPSLGTISYAEVDYTRCDITNADDVRTVFKKARPTVVIHTAAVNLLGAARYSMKGKDAVFSVNVGGTRNVIEASIDCGAKAFVYTSSVTVLLDELDRDFVNADESWATGRATTIYGQSKVFQPYVTGLKAQSHRFPIRRVASFIAKMFHDLCILFSRRHSPHKSQLKDVLRHTD